MLKIIFPDNMKVFFRQPSFLFFAVISPITSAKSALPVKKNLFILSGNIIFNMLFKELITQNVISLRLEIKTVSQT
jgi:hypothetical protein